MRQETRSQGWILDSKGMTLVELMVVAGVLGVLMVGFMQFMTFQQRSIKTAELKGDVATVRNMLAGWIENAAICNATFAGLSNRNSQTIAQLLRAPGDVILNLDFRFPATNWKVQAMDLLSSTEATAVSSTFNGAIEKESGVGDALIKVTLRQMRAGSQNVTVTNANVDRGNYAEYEKVLYFPIRAVFAEFIPIPITDVGATNASGIVTLSQDAENEAKQACSAAGTIEGTPMLDRLTATAGAPVTSANSAFFLDPDVVSLGGDLYMKTCLASSANLPIERCVPAGSSAGF
jgi:prepilin-type N-terminal cleavage/methylation domain-containing protein